MWRFVRFVTSDGIRLNGALAGGRARRTLIHVHGKCGNFYENVFVQTIASAVTKVGWNFLAFNNRGTACLTEAYIGGRVSYIGGSVELFEDAEKDIDAAVQFAAAYGPQVVLQGHSSGCDKVIHYAVRNRRDLDLILLSASDSYALQSAYIYPESISGQLDRLRTFEDDRWLAEDEYGIKVGSTKYPIPVTTGTLRNFIAGPAFDLLRLDTPPRDMGLTGRVFGLWGGDDPLQIGGTGRMIVGLQQRIPQVQVQVLDGADHHFSPREKDLAGRISLWLH